MVAVIAYWVHNLRPEIIRFNEHFAIRWYGVSYVCGFLIGIWLLHRYTKKGRSPLTAEENDNLLIALIAGVFLGGRLGYMLLYGADTFFRDPLVFFRVWEGGMASHGGFLGVFLALWWYCHKNRKSLLQLGDIVVTIAPPGLLLGRIANFINGELWGHPTMVPWAVVFPQAPVSMDHPMVYVEAWNSMANPRHPSQIYEALLEGLLLLVYTQWRFWQARPGSRSDGHLAGEFIFLYAVVRIVGEQFRVPDASLILGMSRGIFYSLFFLVIGGGLVGYSRWRQRRKMEVLTGVSRTDRP